MSTSTARVYRSNFAGRFMPSEKRKSPQNKAFYGHQGACSGKAHCIKDSVLLDEACGSVGFLMNAYNKIERGELYDTP